jgi:hypothetical protein
MQVLKVDCCIVGMRHQHADPSHHHKLLRARRERPRPYRAAKRDNKFSPLDVLPCDPPRGPCPCDGSTLPRFDRAVCGYVMFKEQSIPLKF